ncbi:MAG: hypothetical protein AAGC74_06155 [Verrucomicrobiota bacterium]
MNLFLLDAIGPFFRNLEQQHINWSKIPFDHLPLDGPRADEFWSQLQNDFESLIQKAKSLGFNAVSLDDVSHLTPHPWHNDETNQRIQQLAARFNPLFTSLKQHDLQVWVTADVLTLSPHLEARLGTSFTTRNSYFNDLTQRFLEQHPLVTGLILRIGEADGLDVKDELRSHLHLRSAKQVNAFLKNLLPIMEAANRDVILRTWTVGAHRVGDLIWHRGRLSEALDGIDSPHFILSMKPGESDFFRHLPLNRAFFRYPGRKILELQARREYEGAGEFPSWIGPDCEQLSDELASADNMHGISVWCQTGGWLRFKRLPFIQKEGLWTEINACAAIDIFKNKMTAAQSLAGFVGEKKATAANELLHHTRHVIETLYYIPEFARQKLFFRRVRIPPLLHIYWDSIYIFSPVRKVLRHFVKDHEGALHESEGAMNRFPRILELAKQIDFPVDDLRFMRDTCGLIHLARIYYFSSYNENLVEEIREAKRAYKRAWPMSVRPRYRIKTHFKKTGIDRKTLFLLANVFVRRKRGYRTVLDRLFTLNLLSFLYRLFQNRSQQALPKNLRNTAMGLDSLFK